MSNSNYFDRILQSVTGEPPVPDSVTQRQANYDLLAGRVDGGHDPEYISMFENFHGMEHSEIFRLAQSISPVAMSTLATEWAKLGTGFAHTVGWGTLMIRKLISERWEGDAATAAADATIRFGASAGQLSDATRAVSEKLRIAADIGERVKSSVPPPPSTAPLPLAVFTPTAAADAARQSESIRTQAIQVMEALYKPYYRDSGSAVPVLPPPYDNSGGSEPASFVPRSYDSAGPAGVGGSSATSGGDEHNPGVAEQALAASDQAAADATGTDSAGEQGRDDQPGSTHGGGAGEPAQTVPTATGPAGVAPTGGQPGQPYGSSTSTPGTGTGGGSYGGGAGGSSHLGPSPLSAGAAPLSAGPAPVANSPATAPAGTTSRGAGMRPMGMMPGMMPPGAARGDDQDKRVASYLVTNEHGSELIGAIPDTAPPVLGADPL